MKAARRALLELVLYAAYATTVGALLTRAVTSQADTLTQTSTASTQSTSTAPGVVAASQVVVGITSGDVSNPFTIHCVTTRDRIASDMLMIQSTDDLDEVEKQLGCQPEWQP
jgi:hypothetical protein